MHRLFFAWLIAIVAISFSVFGHAQGPSPAAAGMLVYFGTYTGAKSKGVYVSRLDSASGALRPPQLAAETASPSFLAVHPTGNFLYTVNEVSTFDGQASGSVSAFAVDRKTGLLKALNQQSSEGPGPAHLIVDKDGRNVLVANYGGGSVAVLPIGTDGRLKAPSAFVQHTGSSVNPQRQKGRTRTRSTSILRIVSRTSPISASTRVLVYRFDAGKGLLTLNDPRRRA